MRKSSKLGGYPAEVFVRVRLKIIASGEIIEYEFINKSGFPSFDQAAELAVRNAVLDPLPQALAQNPPYIVLIRIVPQN
jgi:TonB family protein